MRRCHIRLCWAEWHRGISVGLAQSLAHLIAVLMVGAVRAVATAEVALGAAVRAAEARVAVEREAAAKAEESRAAEAMEAEERAEAERAEGAWRWPVDEDLIRSGGSGGVGCGRGEG